MSGQIKSESKTSEPGISECYDCKHYDWAIIISRVYGSGSDWEHICKSDASIIPGDHIINCHRYIKCL